MFDHCPNQIEYVCRDGERALFFEFCNRPAKSAGEVEGASRSRRSSATRIRRPATSLFNDCATSSTSGSSGINQLRITNYESKFRDCHFNITKSGLLIRNFKFAHCL